ncbi:hypothetical protein N8A98_01845 (plasmid) [Devosia neptuniae]|uniref:Uncharacterized protein n=1 Tax=Devosia neptuniae TaxID=191302 RepID=A0ABY6CCG0_9HYPH|nr:hypothetical protein [Devosia neptuniae]UXN67828.1 hypothetical protein N8A98_01845 [Devosia neptuniae]
MDLPYCPRQPREGGQEQRPDRRLLRHLEKPGKALATFAGHTGDDTMGGEGGPETDPLHPEEELLEELSDAIEFVGEQLEDNGFDLAILKTAMGFARNKALVDARRSMSMMKAARSSRYRRARFSGSTRPVSPSKACRNTERKAKPSPSL